MVDEDPSVMYSTCELEPVPMGHRESTWLVSSCMSLRSKGNFVGRAAYAFFVVLLAQRGVALVFAEPWR